jgi:hypothetical protein
MKKPGMQWRARYSYSIVSSSIERNLQESRKSGSTIGVLGKFSVGGLSSERRELHAPIFEWRDPAAERLGGGASMCESRQQVGWRARRISESAAIVGCRLGQAEPKQLNEIHGGAQGMRAAAQITQAVQPFDGQP